MATVMKSPSVLAQPPERSASRCAMGVLTLLFFMWGFLTSLNDILMPHLKAIFDLKYVEVMLIQFSFFSAYLIFAMPSGRVDLEATLSYTRRNCDHPLRWGRGFDWQFSRQLPQTIRRRLRAGVRLNGDVGACCDVEPFARLALQFHCVPKYFYARDRWLGTIHEQRIRAARDLDCGRSGDSRFTGCARRSPWNPPRVHSAGPLLPLYRILRVERFPWA